MLGIIICLVISVSFAQQSKKTKAPDNAAMVKNGLELYPKTILVDKGYTQAAKEFEICSKESITWKLCQ